MKRKRKQKQFGWVVANEHGSFLIDTCDYSRGYSIRRAVDLLAEPWEVISTRDGFKCVRVELIPHTSVSGAKE